MRKPIIAAALFALSIAAPAFAAVDNACWNRNLQRMDFFMSPPQSGDSQFFSSVGTKGVVALLFATRNTMNAFPTSLYEFRTGNPSDPTPTGCSNLTMNALRYYMSGNEAPSLQGSFSTALTYPDPEPAYTKVLTVSDGIDPTLFYQYGKWPNGPPGSGATSTPLTALNACNAATANNVVLSSQCQSCVNTRGFWLNPTVANNDTSASAAVFSGKWLRFYPPKWILLKLAYKRLLNGPLLSSIREGVITFNGATGGQVIQKLLPNSCQGQGATTGTGILKQKLGALDGLNYSSAANPLAEMLFNAAYFSLRSPLNALVLTCVMFLLTIASGVVALFRLKDTRVALSLATLFIWLIVALTAATFQALWNRDDLYGVGPFVRPSARLVKKQAN